MPLSSKLLALLARRPLLPVALLGVMVVVGLLLETFLYGGARWLAKLPLVVLMLWLVLRQVAAKRRGQGPGNGP